MKRLLSIMVLTLTIFVAANGAAGSVTVGDVTFPKTITVFDTSLQLKGAGVLTYLRFIKAYAGAFYLPTAAAYRADSRPLPRRLELSYYRAISAADFDTATRQKVAGNVDAETLSRLAARLDRFCAAYRDVEPGDRYALTFIPGRGTELSLNGVPLIRISGADFADAVFAIWLGGNPIDTEFRDTLLGNS